MLIFNNLKFAVNQSEFVSSLFHHGGTCHGYYKKLKYGIQLMDQNKNLKAFIHKDKFIVKAFNDNGKAFYMLGIDDKILTWLNIDNNEKELIEQMYFTI